MGEVHELPIGEASVSTAGPLADCQAVQYRYGLTWMADCRFRVGFIVHVAAQAGLGQRDQCEGILGLGLQHVRRREKQVGTPPVGAVGVHPLERDSLEKHRGQIRLGESPSPLPDLAGCTARQSKIYDPALAPESGRDCLQHRLRDNPLVH